MKLVTHKRTQLALENYLKQMTHGLILVGREGSGKYYTAKWLANTVGYNCLTIEPLEDKKTISIDQVRELYGLTKTGGNLIVIVKDAHNMGHEAQNAFLKLLEEPPKNTHFILTTANIAALLPTIRSRSQTIEVLPPTTQQATDYGNSISEISPAELRSIIMTTGRRMGLLTTMLTNKSVRDAHQHSVAEAKKFYTSSQYDRHVLCIVHNFEKEWIATLLELLATIIQTLITQQNQNQSTLTKLSKQAELVEQTAHNTAVIPGNPKIHLARLIINL